MTICLQLDGVSVAYGRREVVRDCSFALPRGMILSLLGASGCGKSTLLKAIAGLLPLHRGEIRMQGRVVASPHIHVAPQMREVGMIFQDYALFPHLTVQENIAFGLAHLPKGERDARVHEMLGVVQMRDLHARYPHQISGGQQQRVAIARALVREPACLLLDEPFSNLDNAVREALLDDMQRLFRARGISAVFVTHNKTEALAMSDMVAVIRKGTIAQIDTPTALYDHPASDEIAAFLGHGALLRFAKGAKEWVSSAGSLGAAQRANVMVRAEDADSAEVFLRPHQFVLASDGQGNGAIESARFLGDFSLYRVRLAEQTVEVLCKQRLHVGENVRLRLAVHG